MDTVIGSAVVAAGLGLLLGLERERSQRGERLFAGIRTFPLLSLAGWIGGWASTRNGPLVLPMVLLAVTALAVASYFRTADREHGITTEISAVLAVLLGALVGWDQVLLAAALAVIATLLLTLKTPLHRLAGAMTSDEILAIAKFGLVLAVLLPLLPSDPIGPYGAIVPRRVGVVVAIISAVSLAGYALVRLVGGRTGWALAGLLGGVVSSTAATLSLSGKAKTLPELTRPLAAGILLASTVLYVRCFFLAWAFDQALAFYLGPRLVLLLLVLGLFALLELRAPAPEGQGGVGLGNPVELGRAGMLALLLTAILVAGNAAQAAFGTAGLWATGALAGLVDVDAVLVASAALRRQNQAPMGVAAGVFLLATVSNLLVKGLIVILSGGRPLARRVLPGFIVVGAVTTFLLFI